MTIEQKAKAYDEALEKAIALYKVAEPMSGCNVLLETVFPELKESKDDRIRKALIKYFSEGREYLSLIPYNKEECVAWLEKQGEQKPNDEEMKELLRTEYEKGRADTITEMHWSKEDERIYQSIIDDTVQENQLDNRQINWIKSLKDRVQPQSQWKPSEEQIKQLGNCIGRAWYNGDELVGLYNDLKKLKGE